VVDEVVDDFCSSTTARTFEVFVKLPSPLQFARRVADAVLPGIRSELDQVRFANGQVLAKLQRLQGAFTSIHDAEFKVYSQYGEDGIIQYLIREAKIVPSERKFVEFGVESYLEANTRFLLMNDYWSGLIIDGSVDKVQAIRESEISWRYHLRSVQAWIDRESINELLVANGSSGRIGLLSIDIDGNDYWVWEQISVVDPVIVICEFNSIFGAERAVTIPYDRSFSRTKAHHSNLFWGASLGALARLAQARGFALVGCNRAGNNAFFVKHDRLGNLRPLSVADAYTKAQFAESRDQDGRLTFLRDPYRIREIAELDVFDLERECYVSVGEVLGRVADGIDRG
jgi:hypothetical protein